MRIKEVTVKAVQIMLSNKQDMEIKKKYEGVAGKAKEPARYQNKTIEDGADDPTYPTDDAVKALDIPEEPAPAGYESDAGEDEADDQTGYEGKASKDEGNAGKTEKPNRYESKGK